MRSKIRSLGKMFEEKALESRHFGEMLGIQLEQRREYHCIARRKA